MGNNNRTVKTEDKPELSKKQITSELEISKFIGLRNSFMVLLIVFCMLFGFGSGFILKQAQQQKEAKSLEPESGTIQIREKDGMEMVYIPSGTFSMGSTAGGADEQPVHEVFLDGYWIDKYEINNEQYNLCVVEGVCTPPYYDLDSSIDSFNLFTEEIALYPVNSVIWYQAKVYCQWVGGDLPTEAQWEKAARGSDDRIFPWGNTDPTCSLSNFSRCVENTNASILGHTNMVGSYPEGESPYGVMDMAGNVWEWVNDWYSEDYYSLENSALNPTGPDIGEFRVLRGGSWFDTEPDYPGVDYQNDVHVTDRNVSRPNAIRGSNGFRCVYFP